MAGEKINKKVFIGVAWPYVNGSLHIGHLAGYLLPSDICSRYNRAVGNDTLMVSGSDCFGTPVTVEADKTGVSSKEIVAKYHKEDVEIFLEDLNLTYDLYTKTDHPNHIDVVQKMFLKLLKDGYIFVDETKQYFSPSDEKFLPDRYVVGQCSFCGFKEARSDQCDNCGKLLTHRELIDPKSSLTGKEVDLKSTQHYFVDWPKLQPFIQKYVDEHAGNWKNWVRQEAKGWLREGLKPRAITRDISWGIPLPKNKIPEDKLIDNIDSKRIYVWFEAVIGYLSASILWAEKEDRFWEDFWYEKNNTILKHYYFMGKDNLVFHTLFWPAQIHFYDKKLHLPDVNSINMFLNFEGRQFSKSRGVSVGIRDIVKRFGNDAVRFYITLMMPEFRDSSFSWSDFEEKVNGVLVSNLGNFIHRVVSLAKGDKNDFNGYKISTDTLDQIKECFSNSILHLENCEFRKYLEEILSLSRYGNGVVDKKELWSLYKKDPSNFNQTMYDLICIIIALGYLMSPVLFEASEKLFEMLGLSQKQKDELSSDWTFALEDRYAKGHDYRDVSVKKIRLHLARIIKKIDLPSNPSPLFDKIEL